MEIKLDSINKKIINYLKDGRISYKKIASELSLAENTVKSRIQKLKEAGIIDITTLVNPEIMKNHKIVFIGIQIDNLKLVQTAESINALKGVISTSVVTGRYDLMIIVHLFPDFGLLEFLSEELSKIEGITLTETFIAYKNYNFKIQHQFDIDETELI